MARARYQVLVIPYIRQNDTILYCVLKRSDAVNIWQFIAGGGEEEDGSALVSARREAGEEAGISPDKKMFQLETVCSISTEYFDQARLVWGEDCLVIPEYAFAVEVTSREIRLSDEHAEYRWVDYQTAKEMLRYDSNKTALWELDNKLRGSIGRDSIRM